MSDELDDNTIPEEVVKEARAMGWRPQEEFKGNPEKWVPADEFIEKGRHVLPILQENNKRLARDLLTRDEKIGNLERQLQELNERLERQAAEDKKRENANLRATLTERLKQARREDDVDAEMEIREALDKIKDEPAPQPKKKDDPKPKDDQLSPEFKSWQAENPWFGGESAEDKKKTKAFLRIAEDLRDEGDTSAGVQFFEKVEQIYKEQHGEKPPQSDKYNSGSNRGGSRGTASKSYESLPAEAKQACMEDAEALVGDGKKFKNLKEWQNYYAKTYWEND